MTRTYLFKTDKGRFIINDERSKIGYGYPRIFVECENGDEYVNVDFTLGAAFKMKKTDFESWLDGSEVRGADLVKVCGDLGLIHDSLVPLIAEIQSGSSSD